MPSPRYPVSGRELNFIKRCIAGGHYRSEIANMVGRTPSSLRGIINYYRLGDKPNRKEQLSGADRQAAVEFMRTTIWDRRPNHKQLTHLVNIQFGTTYSSRSIYRLLHRLDARTLEQHRLNMREAQSRRQTKKKAPAYIRITKEMYQQPVEREDSRGPQGKTGPRKKVSS